MALVTFCGFPSSGKSTRARELEAFLSSKLSAAAASSPSSALARLKVQIINDESLALSKSAYDDSASEKPARASFFSAVNRALSKETIVIADAMNYIKGSRYQMYCQAREIGVRTCTVFIATTPDQCKAWNDAKPQGERYIEPTLENLISRFEEPNSAARWDSPLVTIPHSDGPLDSEAGSELAEQIWANITQTVIKPPNVATLPIATSSTSYLTLLEQTTSILISSLLSHQSLSPLSAPTTLPLPTTPPCKVTIQLAKPVTLASCQRLRRQFSKMNMYAQKEFPAETIARLFAEYLEGAVNN